MHVLTTAPPICQTFSACTAYSDPKVLDANGRGFCRPSGKGKFELQDGAVAIEFRSSAADAAGTLHTMICTNSYGTHVLPPMTTVTVEDVFAPGKWS